MVSDFNEGLSNVMFGGIRLSLLVIMVWWMPMGAGGSSVWLGSQALSFLLYHLRSELDKYFPGFKH